jgi:pyridoxamine 5'-phosphate oxidase family protein
MVEFTDAETDYLDNQLLARFATAGADGRPHVVPLSFRFDRDLGTVDCGGFQVETTKRWRDVQANPWVAIVVDDLESVDPWRPRMLQIRGRAETVTTGGSGLGPGFGDAFIRIHPATKNSYGIS